MAKRKKIDPQEKAFLAAIADAHARSAAAEKRDAQRVYADWLEEQGRGYDMALMRAKAGDCTLRWEARDRRTGTALFSTMLKVRFTNKEHPQTTVWEPMSGSKPCLPCLPQLYSTPAEEVEVVVVMLRPQDAYRCSLADYFLEHTSLPDEGRKLKNLLNQK